MQKQMTHMTWQEFEQSGESILALCVGSIEQHGPHMCLTVDLQIPYNLCKELSQKCDMIVAPPLYYGYRSQPATGGGQAFPGTTAVSGQTLITIVKEIMEDFYRQGKRRFLLMSGHFENTAFMSEASYLFSSQHKDAKVVIANWWELVKEETLDRLFDSNFPGWEVEHASLTETSLMMHFCPDMVHEERIPAQKGEKHQPRPIIYPEPRGLVPASGILFSADRAGAEIGRVMAEEIVDTLLNIVKQEF